MLKCVNRNIAPIYSLPRYISPFEKLEGTSGGRGTIRYKPHLQATTMIDGVSIEQPLGIDEGLRLAPVPNDLPV